MVGMETTDPTTSSGAKRRRFTETERSEHLAAWKRSGRSARAYAETHDLSAANLYAWSAKERTRQTEGANASPFVPVRIAPAEAGGPAPGLRVTVKASGLECVIEGAGEPAVFAALIASLKREVFDV
jgi:transposase-like protein